MVTLFIAEAVVFTVQANNETDLKCPALQEQYQEMMLEHKDAVVPGVAGACGDKSACQGDCENCEQPCQQEEVIEVVEFN